MSVRLRLLSAYCLVLIAASGCAHVPLDTRYAGPAPLPHEVADDYVYPNPPSEVTIEPVRSNREFREFMVRFPLSVEGFEPTEPMVEFEWFESTQPGRRPTILFNPILGGDYPLERGICRFFARYGFHVALLHRKTLKISPEHQPERLELLLRQAVLRIRQVVDWMAAHERVDPTRLGSFGISMGGMVTVIAAAVEPRLCCHVVVLAGGSIPDVVLGSNDRLLTKPIARYLERNGMDRATLEQRLRASVKTDPLLLAPYADARRMLMVIALTDRTIGRANAFRLWRALGRPEAVFLPFGHYTSYCALPYVKFASLRFFREQLADNEAGSSL